MWEKVSLLIVDDDQQWCKKLKAHLDGYPAFDVMEPIHSGDKAIEFIELHRPGVILLDLLLPVFDGMYIIEYIADNMHGYQPIIYVLSMVGTEKTNMMLMDCKTVKYYSIKPVHPNTVVNHLHRFLSPRPHVEAQADQDCGLVNRDPPDDLRNLDWLIEDYLSKLGVRTSMLQRKCARVAIELCIRAGKNSRVSMMEIYKQVGQTFTPPLSSSAVERNIRSAVTTVKKMHTPLFKQYFSDGGLPLNNGAFVQESANRLRRWMTENHNATILSQQNSVLLGKR